MARFTPAYLDELKGRLRRSEVIGRAANLKRQRRAWAGLSPFAKEKRPSFFVNDDKRFWHDFSSGKHGDLIGFLQENKRLTFCEAVERALVRPDHQLTLGPRRSVRGRTRRSGPDRVSAA